MTKGRFLGALNARWSDDDRTMILLTAFGYVDPRQVEWPVPAGAMTDGASIPQVFWSITGGPFEGRYRKAAVVHDYYCDIRLRTPDETHRMFYDAMICAGVAAVRAKVMYMAVLFGGPRWNLQAIHNSKLSSPGTFKGWRFDDEGEFIWLEDSDGELLPPTLKDAKAEGWAPVEAPDGGMLWAPPVIKAIPTPRQTPPLEKFEELAERVRAENPSVEEIEKLAAQARFYPRDVF